MTLTGEHSYYMEDEISHKYCEDRDLVLSSIEVHVCCNAETTWQPAVIYTVYNHIDKSERSFTSNQYVEALEYMESIDG